jgi:hypothetical protein
MNDSFPPHTLHFSGGQVLCASEDDAVELGRDRRDAGFEIHKITRGSNTVLEGSALGKRLDSADVDC